MRQLDYRLLGPLEVVAEGVPLRLGRRQQRAVLAILLLHVNRAVSADQLIEQLWPEKPPGKPQTAIQGHISGLRKVLGREAIRTAGGGYALRVEAGQVDAHRFERLLRESRDALGREQAEEAAEWLGEALSLWRGNALADFTYEAWAHDEIARLEELRLVAREEQAEAALALGRHAALVPELETFVREHPLRERTRAQLMLALYRCGRQAEALDAFQQARTRLVEDLGIDPSTELQALYKQILNQDESLAAPVRAPSRQLPVGTVTLLFTDIEGSTSLLRERRAEYAEILDAHDAILREAVAGQDGHEIDMQGDAFLFAFARPTDAVAAAAWAQRALEGAALAQSWPLHVRVGIHTGEVTDRRGKYVGVAVHRGARICGAAHGGQVLVSQATADLVADEEVNGVGLRDLGLHRLKDLSEPQRLYQLQIEGLPHEFPALKTLENRPTNLPAQPTVLIGRERELDEIDGLLCRDDVHLLTLTGAGGTGKTRLALQVAADLVERFPSGVFFVSLAAIRDADLVVPTIAQTLGLRGEGGEPLLETLDGYLRDKRMLLLLDNFEQIVQAAPALASLLASAPELKLLVTSRTPLHLSGERTYEVPALSLPDLSRLPKMEALGQYEAVALFIERAQAAKAGFAVTNENARAVAEICVRLDGLPLALELAAARIRVLPPRTLVGRLDERLKLLTGGGVDLDERQRTLRATIAWSYELLSGEEKTLFARLSVFLGGCRIEAAEAVCDPDGELGLDILDGLTSLVEKSLIQQREDPDAEPRFWMLETIKEYAVASLNERRESEEVRQRHAEHFRGLAERAEAQLTGPQQAAWFERLERELDNLRIALTSFVEAGDAEQELRISSALWRFWATRGDRSEGRKRLEEALARDWPQPLWLRERALAGASRLAQFQRDRRAWQQFAEERLAVNQKLANRCGIAAALIDLAMLTADQGDSERAKILLQESRSISHELGETREEARAIGNLGALAWEDGDYEHAAEFFGEAIPFFEMVGDLRGIAVSSNGVGRAAVLLQRPQEALPYLSRSLTLAQTLSDQHEASLAIEGLALVALQDDDPERTARLLAQADALRRAVATSATPSEEAEFEHAASTVRAQLEPAAFDLAWSQGGAMSLDEAVAYALEDEPLPASPPRPSLR
jgi:predicted ATPase/DNA-binding SARP family transcriptional activator